MSKWLSRDLINTPFLILCLSENEFVRVAKHCKLENAPRWISDQADATTHILKKDEETTTVVCVKPHKNRAVIYGLLVHEAVHVWRQVLRDMGESFPGEETEAYCIQSIAQRLISEYMRRKKNV